MQIYSDWLGLKEKHKNIVVGLGNFDGIHLGHQKLINDLVTKAQAVGGTPTVFTFVPHPMKVLKPEDAPPMILPLNVKRRMFADFGVEVLLWIPFTNDFASMSPKDFIVDILHQNMGVRAVYIGYNHTFGHQGKGTPELLRHYGDNLGFDVEILEPVQVNGQTVSSTFIRSLLADGEIAEAAKYLGYHPFIEGEVVYGERRGSTLGFPTANLNVDTKLSIPANGVYSVKVKVDNRIFWGVTNIGTKPTFHGNACTRTVEAHLLDFSGNLYGKKINVCFIRRLRDEKRFNSVDELVEQIHKDIYEARLDSAT